MSVAMSRVVEPSLMRIIGEGRRGVDSIGSNSTRLRFRPAVGTVDATMDEEVDEIQAAGVASVALKATGELRAATSSPFLPL